jgi:hypothetical protein
LPHACALEELMTERCPDEGVALLLDLLERLEQGVRGTIAPLSAEALAWQPDSRANGIGVTVWHFSRWLDVIAARALRAGASDDEGWFANGWAARTGYDPRGLGVDGLGVLTGYTLAEALAVPPLSADDLLAYHHEACAALAEQLRGLTSDELRQPAPGLRQPGSEPTSGREWVLDILLGSLGHLGEIRAIKALQARATAPTHALE